MPLPFGPQHAELPLVQVDIPPLERQDFAAAQSGVAAQQHDEMGASIERHGGVYQPGVLVKVEKACGRLRNRQQPNYAGHSIDHVPFHRFLEQHVQHDQHVVDRLGCAIDQLSLQLLNGAGRPRCRSPFSSCGAVPRLHRRSITTGARGRRTAWHRPLYGSPGRACTTMSARRVTCWSGSTARHLAAGWRWFAAAITQWPTDGSSASRRIECVMAARRASGGDQITLPVSMRVGCTKSAPFVRVSGSAPSVNCAARSRRSVRLHGRSPQRLPLTVIDSTGCSSALYCARERARRRDYRKSQRGEALATRGSRAPDSAPKGVACQPSSRCEAAIHRHRRPSCGRRRGFSR